jgi:hypothetical protein
MIARTMPTLTVIKHFDVIKNITAGFFPRSVDLFFIRSRFNNWKNFLQPHYHDSATTHAAFQAV